MFVLALVPWFAAANVPCTGDFDGFGMCIERVDDLDGDGVDDLAIGDPNPDPGDKEPGCVWIVSGAKHTLIARLRGPEADKWFGQSVAYLPKSSSNPKGLIVVGSAAHYPEYSFLEHQNSGDSGRVYVFDGDGSTRKTLTSDDHARRFGLRVRCAGDVDGDGYSDVLVCSPPRERRGHHGSVELYSGKTFEKLLAISVFASGSEWDENAIVLRSPRTGGACILALTEELRVSEFSRSVVLHRIVRNDDKLAAEKIATIRGAPKEMSFGYALSDAGDLDDDGWPELAISAPVRVSSRKADDPPDAEYPCGRVVVVSTRDGSVKREVSMTARTGLFGADACVGNGTAWKGGKVLMVATSVTPGSSAGNPSLSIYSLDSGELVERLDAKGSVGTSVLVLHGRSNEERIVTARCDCDPEGWPGAVAIFAPNDKRVDVVLRRSDLKAQLK